MTARRWNPSTRHAPCFFKEIWTQLSHPPQQYENSLLLVWLCFWAELGKDAPEYVNVDVCSEFSTTCMATFISGIRIPSLHAYLLYSYHSSSNKYSVISKKYYLCHICDCALRILLTHYISVYSDISLTFGHHESCILGQAFHQYPENAFYIFNQQICFIIWYLLDRASLI